MVRTAALICAAAALGGLSACGGDDREEAEQTVRDFVTATRERDEDRFCDEIVTQEFLEQTTGVTGDQARQTCKREFRALSGLRVELTRIRRTTVDGDEATVAAVLRRQGQELRQRFRLKKEDGDWKIAGGGE